MAEYNIEGNSIDAGLIDPLIDDPLSFQTIPATTEVVIFEAPDVVKTSSTPPTETDPYDSPNLSALNPIRRSRPKWYTRFFEPIPGSQQKRHRCVECGWEGMAIPESLSNLKRHFTFKKYTDCKLKFINWEAENATVPKYYPDLKPFVPFENDSPRLTLSKDRPSEDVYFKLANFVVSAEVPLSTIDCPEFLSFCQALNPQYSIPYSSTIKSLMEKMKSSSDEVIQVELSLAQVVTLSVDGWCSPHMMNMIGVIVNYQTPNCIAKSELIGIDLFRGNCTSESLANFILEVSKCWGIESKVVRIGLDKKSQNFISKATLELKEEFSEKLAISDDLESEREDLSDLEEISSELINSAAQNVFFKLNTTSPDSVLTRLRSQGLLPICSPCVRHNIQLVIYEFLKTQLGYYGSLDKLISKANSFVRAVKGMANFSEVFSEHKLELVSMDVNEWDSMYQMVLSLITAEERGVLNILSEVKTPSSLSNYEFSILREIAAALEPLHLFTLELEYSRGCSAIILPALKLIHEELSSAKQEDSGVQISEHKSPSETLSSAMLNQFKEVTQDNFLIIASCLDPRFAAKALEAPNSMNLLTHAMKAMIESESVNELPIACTEVPQAKRRKSLFDSFREKSSKIPDADRINMEVTAFKAESNLVAGMAEVDPYLWWERKTTQFPILYKLSRIYLTPAESVCGVRLVNLVSRIYSRYPPRSSVDTIQLLVTLRFRMLRMGRKVPES